MAKGLDSDGNPKRTPRAASATPPKGKPATDTGWKKATFVSPTITEAQKTQFAEWASRVDFADLLFKVCESGYKYSGKWDDYSQAYMALLLPVDDQGINAGYILTARARDPLTALYRVCFFHAVLLEGDWVGDLARQDIDW